MGNWLRRRWASAFSAARSLLPVVVLPDPLAHHGLPLAKGQGREIPSRVTSWTTSWPSRQSSWTEGMPGQGAARRCP